MTKHKNGPTLDAHAVARLLEFKDAQRVRILTRKGDLTAYVPAKDGTGWEKKTRENSRRSVPSLYYREDIEAWKEAHPFKERDDKHVQYSDQERAIVLMEARLLMHNGAVSRKRLLDVLKERHGIHDWNTRTYKKVRKILEDAGIPGVRSARVRVY